MQNYHRVHQAEKVYTNSNLIISLKTSPRKSLENVTSQLWKVVTALITIDVQKVSSGALTIERPFTDYATAESSLRLQDVAVAH